MRIFEDEMLEFERLLHKLFHFSLYGPSSPQPPVYHQDGASQISGSELLPAFFGKLPTTNDWKEFERYTHYLLKLLGIQTVYAFQGERQAGKADGFFKLNNMAVIYDCTLDRQNIEESKSEQINNYCNRLKQGSIQVSGTTTEEFYNHHKQVWIITQGKTRRLQVINAIEVKEVSVQDIMNLYQERLTTPMSDQSLEMRLRNL